LKKERFHRLRKFTGAVEKYIRDKLVLEQWSPEQIAAYAKKENVSMVCCARIYEYIHQDKKHGGSLYQHTRHKFKKRKRVVGYKKGSIPCRVSIHDRPSQIEHRERYGDWEMDLIQGEGNKDYILTVIERKSRFIQMRKLPTGKSAEDVARMVVEILLPYKQFVHSITTDNGSEFAKHAYICKKLDTTVYFADPYCSWQKGSIENANKLIRQYIPKKSNFKSFSEQQINEFQIKLNRRPRKILHFDKPVNVFCKLL
jgi:IS30 family transposase